MTAQEYFDLKTGGLTKPTEFIPISLAIILLEEFGRLQYNDALSEIMEEDSDTMTDERGINYISKEIIKDYMK
jgi:hypothetical protein